MSGRLRFLVVALLLAISSAALARTWTDNTGKRINAKFVRVHEGNVVLSRGGRVLMVPFSTLSPEDQDYIRQELEATGQGHLVPPTVRTPAADPATPALTPGGSASEEDRPAQEGSPNGASAAPGVMRTWTDIHGRTIQAQFVRVAGANVILLQDGREVSYPMAGFSSADQQYIRSQVGSGGESGLPARGGMAPRRWGPPTPFRPSVPSFRHDYGDSDEEDESDGDENDYGDENDSDDEDEPDDEEDAGAYTPGTRWRGSQQQYGGRSPYEDEDDENEKGDDSRGSDAAYNSPSARYNRPPSPYHVPAGPIQQRADDGFKQCMECNAVVPGHMKVGDRCPKCGVRWDIEQTESGKWVDKKGRDVSYRAYGRNAIAVGAGVGLLLLAAVLWRAFLGQS